MFENKKKIIIFFAILFLVVSLLILGWFYVIKYYKNFSEVKMIKKDVCRSFPSYIKLSPVVDYIIPKKKFQPWNPLDSIYSLKEQYVFCLLFQSDGDKTSLNSVLSGNNEQFFKEYEILSTVNKIFKVGDCSSVAALKSTTILKELLSKLSNIDENKICVSLKTENSLPIESPLSDEARGNDDLMYLDALRNNNKERCREVEDMYISIACQAYFINNNQFCDTIYNEIKKEACD